MAIRTHTITPGPLTWKNVEDVIAQPPRLVISAVSKKCIAQCRKYLDRKIRSGSESVYGINTGFGALYNQSIPAADLEKLQRNLVVSHACGTGEEVPHDIVRLMLFLKVQGLAYGHSGVAVETVQRLADFYNHDILPVIYQQGSLGASGDLAPLAHLSLPLLGEGEVYFEGRRMKAADALKKKGWKPLHLQSKEGLALLNGTQFMSAYGVYAVHKALRLAAHADTAAALSLDAFDGRTEPFDERIQRVRPHAGQKAVAMSIRVLLRGSGLARRKKAHVQDPYSFRCVPQVHGASREAIAYAKQVLLTEINSVTDNPTLFPADDAILSAGNFHGQPLALSLDFLAIALSELGNISERRTYQLISGQRSLPPFLVANPGLNSGFMIPQYTAAALVSQNKQYCTPASVDSIVSSNGQEDHVSMGANAATKVYKVAENLHTILAIEWFTAAQALEFRRPARTSPLLEKRVAEYRKQVPFVEEDRMLYKDIEATRLFLA